MRSEPSTTKQSKGELEIEKQLHSWHRYYWWEYSLCKIQFGNMYQKSQKCVNLLTQQLQFKKYILRKIIQKVHKDVCMYKDFFKNLNVYSFERDRT